MSPENSNIRGLLIDLDGTVWEDETPIAGAADAILRLREAGFALRFGTNTTRRSRSALVAKLRDFGIEAVAGDLHTAPLAAAIWLRRQGLTRVDLFVAREAFEDFTGFDVGAIEPEAVVVGDLGHDWTFERLNRAFRALMAGAELVALQRNRYWRTEGQLLIDAGPFVAALEYAAGKQAVVVGKPSAEFFTTASSSMGLPNFEVAAIGDDLETDIAGARSAGMSAVLVRTGKQTTENEEAAGREATAVLDSLADLPAWLGL